MRRAAPPVRRDRRGVAVVEFALLLPFILLMLFVAHDGVHAVRGHLRAKSAAVQIGQIISQCEQVSSSDDAKLKAVAERILGSYTQGNAQWELRITAFGRGSDNKDITPWQIRQTGGSAVSGRPSLTPNSKGSALPSSPGTGAFQMGKNMMLFRTEVFLSVDRTPLIRGVSLLAQAGSYDSAYGEEVFISRAPNTDGLKEKGATGCLT